MCFSMPKPKKPPPPPNKLDAQFDALANLRARRAGVLTRPDLDMTRGFGGTNTNNAAPAAGATKQILGG